MKPGPVTEGIGALALALAGYALIFDDLAGYVVAGTLLIYLVYRAASFLKRYTRLAGSLALSREVDKKVVRQGSVARVETKISYAFQPGIAVHMEDLLPPVAVQDQEQQTVFPEPGRAVIRYRMRCMAPGETSFGGLRLTARDPFFSATLSLMNTGLGLPSITIVPVGEAQSGPASGNWLGEMEGSRSLLFRGQETRAYREYIPGDPLDYVDWKLTAKYGKMYVREREGLSGGASMIIIDLPGIDEKLSKEEMSRYSLAATGAVEGTYNKYGNCPLLLISGGNVIASVPSESSEDEVFGALTAVRPTERTAPLYRYLDPVMVHLLLRMAENRSRGSETFWNRYSETLRLFRTRAPDFPFRKLISEAVRLSEAASLHLYTPGRGDGSHLSQVVLEAKQQGLWVGVHILSGTAGVGTGNELQACGADQVEEI
ncbi:MAG: DUF58 domain-containing protein [Methanofollis sp.]|nr:DUF58 domain-containing protein [Methanofollis sp.]